MYGPNPLGFWSSGKAPNCGKNHQFLEASRKYRVVQAFTDNDGHSHPIGEEWTFLGFSFLPYDDGLSWFVSLDGKQEWHIPMQWRPEAEGKVIDALATYVQPI